MTQRRLFDFLDTYVIAYPSKKVLNYKEGDTWKGYTATEVKQKVYQVANSLLKLGINGQDGTPEKQDKIAILSNNRPEWIIADFAAQLIGAVLVPIYPSIAPQELEYILNQAEVKVVYVSDRMLYRKLQVTLAAIPSLKLVYTFDVVEGVDNFTDLMQPITLEEIAEIDDLKAQIKPTQLATIIYTSGTTGNPKGVMLSHYNIVNNVIGSMPCFTMCDENGRVLSFLPLNHIMERCVTYIYLCKGVQIFFAEGMETIGPNLREVKPHVFTTVPRLLEKVYERIVDKGSELKGFKKKVFDWALAMASEFEINIHKNIIYKIKLAIADKLVYSKWREAVGGEIKAIITGSAACQIRLMRLFTAAKIVVMEGYGLTETSPVISINRFEEKDRKFGTIGPVLNNVEVKIAADGEIICKGPNVMMGYYLQPEATAEVLKDGWFYTGDIGEIQDGRFLKITDRKKELFKISGGKYIAPLPLESKIKESPFIDQIMVVGSNEKFVGALIVPDKNKLRAEGQKLGLEFASDEQMLEDKQINKIIRAQLDIYNKNFAEHERVKKFQLLANEWTIETGELTPSLKIKRRKIMEKFGDLVDKLYV
jgi:long-chain acyl-CoA synthetase